MKEVNIIMATGYGEHSENFSFRGFASGLVNSTATTLKSTISVYMPFVSGTIDNASEIASDTADFIRQNRPDKPSKNKNPIIRNILRDSKNALNTALDDIKRGELNFESTKEEIASYLDSNIEDEWGFDGFDDFSEDGESASEDHPFTSAEFAEGISTMARANVNATEISSKAIISHNYKAIDIATNKMVAYNMANATKIIETVSVTNSKLDSINGNLMNLVNYNNTTMNKFIENATKHMAMHESYMTDMISIVKKMTETKKNTREKEEEGFISSMGGFNFKKLGKNLLNNQYAQMIMPYVAMTLKSLGVDKLPKFLEEANLGGNTLGGLIKEINPLKIVIGQILPQLTEGLETIDKKIEKAVETAVYKAQHGNLLDTISNPVIKKLLEAALAKDEETTIAREYNKDATSWTGADSKVLQFAIPSYLSNIESTLTDIKESNDENTNYIVTAIRDFQNDFNKVNRKKGRPSTVSSDWQSHTNSRQNRRNNIYASSRYWDYDKGKFSSKQDIEESFLNAYSSSAQSGFDEFTKLTSDYIEKQDLSKDTITAINSELTKLYSDIMIKQRDEYFNLADFDKYAEGAISEAFKKIDEAYGLGLEKYFDDNISEYALAHMKGAVASKKSLRDTVKRNKNGISGDLLSGMMDLIGYSDTVGEKISNHAISNGRLHVSGDIGKSLARNSIKTTDAYRAAVASGDHEAIRRMQEEVERKIQEIEENDKEKVNVTGVFGIGTKLGRNVLNRAIGAGSRTANNMLDIVIKSILGNGSTADIGGISGVTEMYRTIFGDMQQELQKYGKYADYDENGKLRTNYRAVDGDDKDVSLDANGNPIPSHNTGALRIDKDKYVKVHKGELILDPIVSEDVRQYLEEGLKTGKFLEEDDEFLKAKLAESGINSADFIKRVNRLIGRNNNRHVSGVKISLTPLTEVDEDVETIPQLIAAKILEISENIRTIGNNNIEKIKDDLSENARDWRSGVNRKLLGERDEHGNFYNGVFSSTANKVQDTFRYARYQINGKGYEGFARNPDGTIMYEDGKPVTETYEHQTLATRRNYDKEYRDKYEAWNKKYSSISGKSMSFDDWIDREDKKGRVKSYDQWLNDTVDSTDNIQNKFIKWLQDRGNDIAIGLDLDNDAIDDVNKAVQFIGENATGLMAGGIGGLIANGILGISMGPIIGIGGAIAANSDTVKDFLFGDSMRDGSRKDNGLISKEFQDKFKKHTGTFIASGVLGAAGMTAASKTLLGGLSGTVIHGITGAVSLIPGVGGVVGTLLNGITGIALGPVGGALIGMAAASVMQTDKIQEFLFGEEKDGVRQGGIMGRFKQAAMNLIDPLNTFLFGEERIKTDSDGNIVYDTNGNAKKERRGGLINSISNYIKINFLNPIKHTGEAIKDDFIFWIKNDIGFNIKRIADPLVDKISSFAEAIQEGAKGIGKKIADVIKGAFTPITKAINGIGQALTQVTLGSVKAITKLTLGTAAAPFKILATIFNIGNSRKTFKMKADLLLNDFAFGIDNVKTLLDDLGSIWFPNHKRTGSIRDKIMEFGQRKININPFDENNRRDWAERVQDKLQEKRGGAANLTFRDHLKIKRITESQNLGEYIVVGMRDVMKGFKHDLENGDGPIARFLLNIKDSPLLQFDKSPILNKIKDKIIDPIKNKIPNAFQFGEQIGDFQNSFLSSFRKAKGKISKFGDKLDQTNQAFKRFKKRSSVLRGAYTNDPESDDWLEEFFQSRSSIIDMDARDEALSESERVGLSNDEIERQNRIRNKRKNAKQRAQANIDRLKASLGNKYGYSDTNYLNMNNSDFNKVLKKIGKANIDTTGWDRQQLLHWMTETKESKDKENAEAKALEVQQNIPSLLTGQGGVTDKINEKHDEVIQAIRETQETMDARFSDLINHTTEATDALNARREEEKNAAKEAVEQANVQSGASVADVVGNTEENTEEIKDDVKDIKNGKIDTGGGLFSSLFHKIGGGINNLTGGLFGKIGSGISGAMGSSGLGGLLGKIAGSGSGIASLLPKIGGFLSGPAGIITALAIASPVLSKIDFSALLEKITDGLTGAVKGLTGAIGTLLEETLPKALNNICESMPTLVTNVVDGVADFVGDGLPDLLSSVGEAIPDILSSVMNSVVTVLTDSVPTLLEKVAESIPKIVGSLLDGAVQLVFKGIPKIIGSVAKSIPKLVVSIITGAGKLVTSVPKMLGNLTLGLFNGIKNAIFNTQTDEDKDLSGYSQEEIDEALNDSFGDNDYNTDSVGYGHFMQTDPRWSKVGYGRFRSGKRSTIGAGGCGPTALANAINNVVGRGVTNPAAIARFSTSRGYGADGGTSAGLFDRGARQLGMNSRAIGTNGNSIASSIRHGNNVVVSGRGGRAYTSAGHIMTVRGMDNRGNAIVDDPLRPRSRRIPMKSLTHGMTHAWSIGRGIGYGEGESSFPIASSSGGESAMFYSDYFNALNNQLKNGDNKYIPAVGREGGLYAIPADYKLSNLVADGAFMFGYTDSLGSGCLANAYTAAFFQQLLRDIESGHTSSPSSTTDVTKITMKTVKDIFNNKSTAWDKFANIIPYMLPYYLVKYNENGSEDGSVTGINDNQEVQDPNQLFKYLNGQYNSILENHVDQWYSKSESNGNVVYKPDNNGNIYFSGQTDANGNKANANLSGNGVLTILRKESDGSYTVMNNIDYDEYINNLGTKYFEWYVETETDKKKRSSFTSDISTTNVASYNKENKKNNVVNALVSGMPIVLHRKESMSGNSAWIKDVFGRTSQHAVVASGLVNRSGMAIDDAKYSKLMEDENVNISELYDEKNPPDLFVMIGDPGYSHNGLGDKGMRLMEFAAFLSGLLGSTMRHIGILSSNGGGSYHADNAHVSAVASAIAQNVDENTYDSISTDNYKSYTNAMGESKDTNSFMEYISELANRMGSVAMNFLSALFTGKKNMGNLKYSNGGSGSSSGSSSSGSSTTTSSVVTTADRLESYGFTPSELIAGGFDVSMSDAKHYIDMISNQSDAGLIIADAYSFASLYNLPEPGTKLSKLYLPTYVEYPGQKAWVLLCAIAIANNQSYKSKINNTASLGNLPVEGFDYFVLDTVSSDMKYLELFNNKTISSHEREGKMSAIINNAVSTVISKYKNDTRFAPPAADPSAWSINKSFYPEWATTPVTSSPGTWDITSSSNLPLNDMVLYAASRLVPPVEGGRPVLAGMSDADMKHVYASIYHDVNAPSFGLFGFHGNPSGTSGSGGYPGTEIMYRLSQCEDLSQTDRDIAESYGKQLLNHTFSASTQTSEWQSWARNPNVFPYLVQAENAIATSLMNSYFRDNENTDGRNPLWFYENGYISDPRTVLALASIRPKAPNAKYISGFNSQAGHPETELFNATKHMIATAGTKYPEATKNRMMRIYAMLTDPDGRGSLAGGFDIGKLPVSIANMIPDGAPREYDSSLFSSVGYGYGAEASMRNSIMHAPSSDIYTKDDVYLGDADNPMCVVMDTTPTTSRLDAIISILKEALFERDVPEASFGDKTHHRAKSEGYGKSINTTSKEKQQRVSNNVTEQDRLRLIHEKLARRSRA